MSLNVKVSKVKKIDSCDQTFDPGNFFFIVFSHEKKQKKEPCYTYNVVYLSEKKTTMYLISNFFTLLTKLRVLYCSSND